MTRKGINRESPSKRFNSAVFLVVVIFSIIVANVKYAEAAPVLSISPNKLDFIPGESWTLSVASAQPNSPVTLCTRWWTGSAWSFDCPAGTAGTTDGSGRWSTTETGTLGIWYKYVVIGGDMSNEIMIKVSTTACMLSISPIQASYSPGEAWRLTLSGCLANTDVSICTRSPCPSNSCTRGDMLPNPGPRTTNSTGGWTTSGTFGAGETGCWVQYGSVGTETSNDISFSVGSAPTCTLAANPASGSAPLSGTLTWTTANAPTSCTASGGWSGSKSTTGGSQAYGPISSTTTYTLACSNSYGSSQCQATATIGGGGLTCSPATQTVQVGQAANLYASGGTSYTWSAPGGNPSSGSGAIFSTIYSSPGTYTVTVSSGGSASCTVQVTGGGTSDLEITDFHLTDSAGNTKATFASGERIYPAVTIRNNGPGSASGFYVSIYSNRPSPVPVGTGSDVNVYASEAGSIAAGASKTYSVTQNPSLWSATNWIMSTAGSYMSRAFVDSFNYVTESNENNNQATSAYAVALSPCAGKQCGEACSGAPGVCDGPDGTCYAAGGCLLNCAVPSPGTGNTRVWANSACGRTGSYKCGAASVCGNSLTSCTVGGISTPVTGNWVSYSYPSGSYGARDTFQISLGGVTKSPSGFTILSECAVTKPGGSVIYFDNWGTDVTFPYTFVTGDPEGVWTVDYCDLWSDFSPNGGWPLRQDGTDRTFILDKSPPSITINNPRQNDIYSANFIVNATVTDTYSPINKVFYRWENGSTGPWVEMAAGGYYTASFNVASVSDGTYSIRVRANDSVGNTAEAVVTGVQIDRQPPSIVILSPSPNWYRSNFEVKARVTDSQGVSSVRYRWENGTNGAWNNMAIGADGNYTATFVITSVSSGNYTIRVWANDTLGNAAERTVGSIGVDYVAPSSNMIRPIAGSFLMSPVFNISWTGSDAHSGVRCHYVTYKYCDNLGRCPTTEYNVRFPGGNCTALLQYEFDSSKELPSIADFSNYTFFFRSVALDNAGNLEPKTIWETNATIYTSTFVMFTVTETTTGATVSNGGKVANGRTVNVNVKAKDQVSGTLDITVFYYSHAIGVRPPQDVSGWSNKTCPGIRECNALITIDVSEADDKNEVDYFIMASAGSSELLPPGAPSSSYFYYFVYRHPICNFLVNDVFRTVMGSSELIAIEVRNFQDRFGMVGLEFDSALARFLESGQQYAQIPMNPGEEKIIYARLVSPPPTEGGLPLVITGNSTADALLQDQDTLTITVGYPANFSELGDFAAIAIVLLACLIYLKFARNED